jgi:hypothetical protein
MDIAGPPAEVGRLLLHLLLARDLRGQTGETGIAPAPRVMSPRPH